MAKAPTAKSRLFAAGGVALVAVGLVLDAWFSPPMPRVSVPLLGLGAFILMQLAKQTRDADGVVIPPSVLASGAWIANTEVSFALIDGLCVIVVLCMELNKAPRFYQQIATGVALAMFAITFFVFRLTRSRFEALMQDTGLNLATNQDRP